MISRTINKIRSSKYFDYVIVLSFFAAVFSFLYFTGTLNSGYHFIDDHGMISLKTNLTNSSYVQTLAIYTKNDFLIRFRPLYYPYLVTTIKVSSLNFLNISIFVGFLASLTFSLFYLGMRKIGHSLLESLIFVLLTFIGSQMAIWWRLGTNETIGVFFLSLSFFFMAKCLEKDHYSRNNALFTIFLIMTSLCKESFIVIIPALTLFKIWNEKRFFGITVKESMRKNLSVIIPLIVMIVELVIIKLFIGTNQTGYAGVTSSLAEFNQGVINILLNPVSLWHWIALISLLTAIYVLSFLFGPGNRWKEFVKSIHSLSIYIIFAIALIVPEIILHAKSGMIERYLLPTTFGLAFLVVGILHNTRQKSGKFIASLVIYIFLALSFNTAVTNAVSFADSGRDANSLLSTVRVESIADSKILLVADPVSRFEVSDSIKIYLSYYEHKNLYAYPLPMREYSTAFELGLRDQWFKWFENRTLSDMNGSPDIIIIFDKVQTGTFFSQSELDASEYINVLPDSESHAVFERR